MPGQGRLGDKANAPLDTHGCPACPHPGAIGPAIQGSPDVNVNRRPALRVDDPGIHAACCGANTWTAIQGSVTVFINGKGAHRIGDQNRHCGGTGQLIEGSPNVIVGESSGDSGPGGSGLNTRGSSGDAGGRRARGEHRGAANTASREGGAGTGPSNHDGAATTSSAAAASAYRSTSDDGPKSGDEELVRITVALRDRAAQIIKRAPYRMQAGGRSCSGRATDGLATLLVPTHTERCVVEWGRENDPDIGAFRIELYLNHDLGSADEQARMQLHNLGYPDSSPLDDALQIFQCHYDLPGGNSLDAQTRLKLTGAHRELANPGISPEPTHD